jgi:NhaP-type Na+/H+ or K+/H+ antiporter
MYVLMALILSPTDAALGVAVVKSEAVPEKIRQTINVESGLNDGLALPPILVCIAALSEAGAAESGGVAYWAGFALKQMIFGPIVGALVGWLGGLLMDKASQKGWMSHTFQRIASISLAMIAYALAEEFHGNGSLPPFSGTSAGSTDMRSWASRVRKPRAAVGPTLLLLGLVGQRVVPYWDARLPMRS